MSRCTIDTLVRDLSALPLPVGGVLAVHSSYRALAPVEGGPAIVVEALIRALGPDGTLLAPTFTGNLIDPCTWPRPPPAPDRLRLMQSMPQFDPARSEPYKMGAVATALWRHPQARRSSHPVTSWAAVGPLAEELTRDQPLDDPEGIDGPVGRIYRRDGSVLLVGVGQDANTTIHLAESLLEMPHLYLLPDMYPALDAGGRREWRPILKTTKCSDGFVKLQMHLNAAGAVRSGRVGNAPVQLLRSRAVVRVVADLLSQDPTALLCDDPGCVHCPSSRQALSGWHPAGT